MKSAQVVLSNLDSSRFHPFLVEIRRDGWNVLVDEDKIPLDLNTFGFVQDGETLKFDVAFNAIHGDPGENGRLQGYLESRGIRHTSSRLGVSALTFSKWHGNVVLQKMGFEGAHSILYQDGDDLNTGKIVEGIGLPMFIKPNNSGSSFGVSKVTSEGEIKQAIDKALEEDAEVIIESFMDGVEIACGVFSHRGEIIPLPPTEIRTENTFFDYGAKYLGEAQEITPAEIDPVHIRKMQEISCSVYRKLRASGVIRVDFILVKDRPLIIEVNTIPGISAESIVPQQVQCAGYTLQDFFGMIIEEALA